jgi:GNAT superfamily N-acetyltransferase
VDLPYIANLWEENQEYLKQRLGVSDAAHFGARWVLMPEVPFPKFNHVSMVRVKPEQVEGLLRATRTFFRGQGLPVASLLVTPATTPSNLGAVLFRLGYKSETNPVMIWDGTPLPAPNGEVLIEVATRERAALVFDLIRRTFFPTALQHTLANARRGVDLSYQITATNYVAYYRGVPVGVGMLFVHGEMAGIYNMATLPEFRGRGVATALMHRLIADAGRLGCTLVGLTPTVMGRPLYEHLGFRVAYLEQYFAMRLD